MECAYMGEEWIGSTPEVHAKDHRRMAMWFWARVLPHAPKQIARFRALVKHYSGENA